MLCSQLDCVKSSSGWPSSQLLLLQQPGFFRNAQHLQLPIAVYASSVPTELAETSVKTRYEEIAIICSNPFIPKALSL
ncbi:hypothetical protein SJAG_05233 [Schizosaccharomyces japonicus yFS275]|uniref:Uncharacterized protein n=1 Tax=Schizosaccharomyces japonicus (strain yFS275 / FY16936) TaxID=402676 RepID=B6JXX6_SCHJY|nr:hypothetical protein SJAG_05233 [Schizosaccharomyces japonicus yFS275]EEB06394.1 hypothetical protein SJAG_05233 [Schizosaccharomyces japonicus yFS275]